MARVLLLLLLIAVVSAGGLLWFDYLDVIDIKTVLSPVYKLVGREGRSQPDIPADEPINLDSERLAVRLEAEAMRSLELDKLTEEINSRQAELTQLASELDDRQKALDEREQTKTAEEESDAVKNRNTDQIAEYLNNQAPDNAVPILLAMDDQLAIDVIRKTEERAKAAGQASIVSVWFSLMPPGRAADIQRKMIERPN